MGGSKSQTVGYKYFKGLMAVIGNPIERFLGINPDKKRWLMASDQNPDENFGRTGMSINQPNLFGGDKKEGGWVGNIDIYAGRDYQKQNEYLAEHIGKDVSAYPNLSYMVFRGYNADSLEPSLDKGFQLVSMSGMMKEFMIWVKRTRIKNDGSRQWYERNLKNEIVCEIGAYDRNDIIYPPVGNRIVHIGYYGKSDTIDPNFIVEKRLENKAITAFRMGEEYVLAFDGNGACSVGYGAVYLTEFETGNKRSQANYKISDLGDITGKFHTVIEMILSGDKYDGYKFITDGTILEENITSDVYTIVNWIKQRVIRFEIFGYGATYFEVELRAERTKKELTVGNGFVDGLNTSIFIEKFEYVKMYKGEMEVPAFDINPIHKIREILTDYTAMGKPESDINDSNFKAMADRIYDESLGISWCIQQKSCKEALEELEYHIEGGVRINRQTGLYEVILFRDDLLDLDNAMLFDESNIKSFQPDIVNAEDQINAVNVSFYDRENIKDSSFSLSDLGSFHTIDHENAEDLKFPYFMNRRNAEMVANWKLKQLSTMAWKGTFTTGKYEARKLNKYDVVLLSWKSKNIVNLPVRVMNINLGNGRDNTVTLDFVEVVPYSNISYSSINVDPNPNPILPPQSNSSIVFEMPYFEAVQRMGQTSVDTELTNNPEIGYLMAAAIKPQNNSLNALIFTDGGTGVYTNFEEVGVVEYCAGCYLDQSISQTDTSFVVKVVTDISRVKTGTLVQIDEELLVYESYNTETKVLNVKRGALDTIPKPHLNNVVFHFWDDSSGIDPTTYVDGEMVNVQILTTTPSGIENLDPGNVQSLVIVGRANRPYPPANVRINDIYYPESTIVSNDITVKWVDRNRLQQTGGEILGYFEDGVTREANVTYSLELMSENVVIYSAYNINSNSLIIPSSSLIQNKPHKLKLWSMKYGSSSYQIFEHNFFVEAVSLILSATVTKNKVVGSTLAQADINVNVDESLRANMRFDGSNISGKALPNSIINIEVQE